MLWFSEMKNSDTRNVPKVSATFIMENMHFCFYFPNFMTQKQIEKKW